MKEIKCKNCRASDFKNENGSLICKYCNSMYEKIEYINIKLDKKLKKVIKTDMSKLTVNNCIIKGDMNNITGNFNIIKGDMNNVTEKNNTVNDDMNNN